MDFHTNIKLLTILLLAVAIHAVLKRSGLGWSGLLKYAWKQGFSSSSSLGWGRRIFMVILPSIMVVLGSAMVIFAFTALLLLGLN